MPTIEKLILKMHNQPNGIRFEELARVLESKGFYLDRTKGSHNHFYNDESKLAFTIPKSNPVKAVYVKGVISKLNL